MSGVGVKSNQTIPFFEALAVLDQLQTNQEINDIVMLDDQDFKKNMWVWHYNVEFVESEDHLSDRILVIYDGSKYYYKAWCTSKNTERAKYLKNRRRKGVMMEYPLGLRLISTDRLYLYYYTQDLGTRYSYLYNLTDGKSLYIHGDLVYSYAGKHIFFTYDHEFPYEFILLDNQNTLQTNEVGWFIRNIFADGRHIYMYIDDFQNQSWVLVYDVKTISKLHKIPLGTHDTARIWFNPHTTHIQIQWYVINKLYLYIRYHDLSKGTSYLEKFDLVSNTKVASLQV